MKKIISNKKTTTLAILFLAFIISATTFLQQKPSVLSSIAASTAIQQKIQITNLTYKGQSGKDALTLLKQKYAIEQDKSGLVTAINGLKAASAKHEYWAFYINGKSADIGPAEYTTKNTDTLT